MNRNNEARPEMLTSLLEDMDAGIFAQKIAQALKDVALGVNAHSKKGKVTIDFTFSKIGDSNQVNCVHSIKTIKPTRRGKASEEDATSTPLYVNGRGELSLFPVQNQTQLFEGERAPGARTSAD